jgi:hypothetical protein
VDPTATIWAGPAEIKAKIQGLASPSGPVDFERVFGPAEEPASAPTSST